MYFGIPGSSLGAPSWRSHPQDGASADFSTSSPPPPTTFSAGRPGGLARIMRSVTWITVRRGASPVPGAAPFVITGAGTGVNRYQRPRSLLGRAAGLSRDRDARADCDRD